VSRLSTAICLEPAVVAVKSVSPEDSSLSQALRQLARRPCSRIVLSVLCSFDWKRLSGQDFLGKLVYLPLWKLFIASNMSFFTHATAFSRLCMTFTRRSSSRACHQDLEPNRMTKRCPQSTACILAGYQSSQSLALVQLYLTPCPCMWRQPPC